MIYGIIVNERKFGGNFVVETACGPSAGDSLPVLTRQTKGGNEMFDTRNSKLMLMLEAVNHLALYYEFCIENGVCGSIEPIPERIAAAKITCLKSLAKEIRDVMEDWEND